jgi:8-oxo-dGTP pyrophosphatase MutT (NUDIX family)
MTSVIQKVFAYITHRNRLLVFRHTDFPEAGIQVPAGTVLPHEDLTIAVLREAEEETGLQDLIIKAYLGEQLRNMEDVRKDEIHHRHFYHLLCGGDPPEQWQHDETSPSDGGTSPIRFEFFWAELPDKIPELIADHGVMLPNLETRMNLDNQESPHSF